MLVLVLVLVLVLGLFKEPYEHNSTMTMITVSHVGVPAVVPLGRSCSCWCSWWYLELLLGLVKELRAQLHHDSDHCITCWGSCCRSSWQVAVNVHVGARGGAPVGVGVGQVTI